MTIGKISSGEWLGTFASTAALQALYPAASYAGCHAGIGSVAPYVDYISDGSAWGVSVGGGATSQIFYGPRAIHMFGDSLTDFNRTVVGNAIDHDVRGFMSQAMAVSQGQIQIGTVLGLSGQGAAAINTAMFPVLPTLPARSLVSYFAGANDSNDSAATLLAKLTAGIAAIVAAGHTPIVCTILPNSLWAASQAKDDIRVAVNNGLRTLRDAYMAAGTLVILVEWDFIPFSGNGLTFIPGFFYDGVTHPGVFGSEALGIFWWNTVKPFFSPLITRRTPFRAMGTRFANPNNDGGNATTAPTGWTVNSISSGSQTVSKVRGTDGDSTPWLQVACTPGAAITYTGAQVSIAAGLALSLACELEVDVPDAATLLEAKLRFQNYGGTNYITRHLANPNIASLADYYSAGTKKWFMRLPLAPLTAAESSYFAYIDFACAPSKPFTFRARLLCDLPTLS